MYLKWFWVFVLFVWEINEILFIIGPKRKDPFVRMCEKVYDLVYIKVI